MNFIKFLISHEVPKPTSEQISARQAAAVVKKAAATPEPVVTNTTTEEVPEKTTIPEVEVHPFANPMTYLPCIVFLFIVVAGIFFTVLGAFWVRFNIKLHTIIN